jgi:hypothetical protein
MAKKNMIEKKAPSNRSMLNILFIINSDLPGIFGTAGISTNNFPVPDKNTVRLKLRAFPVLPCQVFYFLIRESSKCLQKIRQRTRPKSTGIRASYQIRRIPMHLDQKYRQEAHRLAYGARIDLCGIDNSCLSTSEE